MRQRHVMVRAGRALVAAGIVLALGAAGCGPGSTALGDDSPPASLDPASPKVVAQDIAFDQTTIAVKAGVLFILVFENRESVSHNVSIYADEARNDRRFEGVLFGGPGTRWYPVPALAAGTYVFVCDLHPTMRGALRAS